MLYNYSTVMFVDYVIEQYKIDKDEALSLIMSNQDILLTATHGIKCVLAMIKRTKTNLKND